MRVFGVCVCVCACEKCDWRGPSWKSTVLAWPWWSEEPRRGRYRHHPTTKFCNDSTQWAKVHWKLKISPFTLCALSDRVSSQFQVGQSDDVYSLTGVFSNLASFSSPDLFLIVSSFQFCKKRARRRASANVSTCHPSPPPPFPLAPSTPLPNPVSTPTPLLDALLVCEK